MKARRLMIVYGAIVLAAACGQDATPTEPGGASGAAPVIGGASSATDGVESAADSAESGTAVPRTATRISLVGVPAIGQLGMRIRASVRLGAEEGGWWWPEIMPAAWATWEVSDPAVATFVEPTEGSLGSETKLLEIVGDGLVTVTVRAAGLADSVRMRALATEPPLSDELAIESFRVVELAYGDTTATDVHWFYAPLLTVGDRTGAGVEVFGVHVEIPDLDTSPYCTAPRKVDPDHGAELFVEVYGDYELTLDWPGRRATGEDASVTVYFLDAQGNPGRVVATGPVAPGPAFRDTYTGGSIAASWQCGHSVW